MSNDKAIELCNMGLQCDQAGRMAEALKYYKKAAELGSAKAMYNIGVCYYYGDGVEKDLKTAAAWYERAAEGGDGDGLFSIAYCYLTGTGVERNDRMFDYWYERAGEHFEARYRIAQLILETDPVTKKV